VPSSQPGITGVVGHQLEGGGSAGVRECALVDLHLRVPLGQTFRQFRDRFEGDMVALGSELEHILEDYTLVGANIYAVGVLAQHPGHNFLRLPIVVEVRVLGVVTVDETVNVPYQPLARHSGDHLIKTLSYHLLARALLTRQDVNNFL
jgi:hypothetical protein